jgi:hypothetical protein
LAATISQETIDDYVAKNAKSHQLKKSFNLKLEYILIPEEKLGSSDVGGLIALSRVGFDSSGNQALVYVDYGRGPSFCGVGRYGRYMLLVKNKRRWTVKKKFTA